MKQTIAFAALLLCLTSASAGQKQKAARRGAAPARKSTAVTPPIVGAPVTIATKTGEQITGQVLEISAFSVRVKQDELESTVPLESIASMRFGDAPAVSVVAAQPSAHSPNFGRDAESMMASLQSMDSATQSGTEYSDYGTRLGELRRATERFVSKYAGSADQTETKMTALFSAILGDYTWARTIWTLRLGQGSAATVGFSDSPVVADTVEVYPDMAQLGSRNKLPADKLIAGLWKQASLKIGLGRRILESAH